MTSDLRLMSTYQDADSVSVDADEGRFCLRIETEEGALQFDIHGIDLDAFYDSVKGRIGPYLREMHEAQVAHGAQKRAEYDRDVYDHERQTGAYARDDPKHEDYHSVHADLWDSREGK